MSYTLSNDKTRKSAGASSLSLFVICLYGLYIRPIRPYSLLLSTPASASPFNHKRMRKTDRFVLSPFSGVLFFPTSETSPTILFQNNFHQKWDKIANLEKIIWKLLPKVTTFEKGVV